MSARVFVHCYKMRESKSIEDQDQIWGKTKKRMAVFRAIRFIDGLQLIYSPCEAGAGVFASVFGAGAGDFVSAFGAGFGDSALAACDAAAFCSAFKDAILLSTASIF
jgi:hypothetical protein